MKVPNPPGLRYAAMFVVALCAFMGVNATMQAAQLWNSHEARRTLDELGDPMAGMRDLVQQMDPEGVAPRLLAPEVVRGMAERRIDVLEQMSGPRMFALIFLSVSCMFAFVAAGRLLRLDGLPREGMRRVLAGSLLLAAFFRTFEGAQSAAVEHKVMRKVPELIGAVGEAGQAQIDQLMVFPVAIAGIWTALMSGLLILLAQYFRSEKVKQVVALQDQQLER